MNKSQEYDFSLTPEITNTFPSKVFVTTTGMTESEISCYQLPENVILQPKLTLSTTYLIAHKCTFTPKYIQAYKWKIPIIKPSFFTHGTIIKLKLYEGLVFSSDDPNPLFINYFLIQGAVYKEEISYCTDFLISDNPSEEKKAFCLKNGIPILKTKNVFLNNFDFFIKKEEIPVLKKGINFYENFIFLLDERLNKNLYNKLKRLILKNEGQRVSLEIDSVDFILTDKNDDHFKNSNKLLYYNFVFDCEESNSLILPEKYKIYKIMNLNLFFNSTFFLNLKEKTQIFNKILCLGGKVVKKKENYVNYFVNEEKKTSDWLDECIIKLKLVKEPKLNTHAECKRILYLQSKRKIFQFTGLPSFFKNKAIDLLNQYNITYVDSEAFFYEKEMTTHLIMGKINTSEKFLSAVANGCWILKPEFLDYFDNSENFNFSKYEWILDDYIEKGDRRLIGCIRPWRRHVANTNKPAFFNWRVKLYCEEEKKMSYQRVIVNGGGVIDEHDFNLVIKSKGYTGEVKEEDVKSTDYIFLYLYKRQE